MWIAPNLITLIGLSFVFVNVLLALWLVPDLIGPGPSWFYYSCAAGIWLYSTFDNVDGRQARRTGSSSPLGELFDHGCDALNCCLGGLIQAAALGLGHSWLSFCVSLLAIVPFYFSTWEEYYTGQLYLGYINGPTEGLVMSCASMLVSGYYGPQIWHTPVNHFLPSSLAGRYFDDSWTLVHIMFSMMTCLLFFLHIPFSLHGVYNACQKKKSSFAKALFGLNTIIVFLAAAYFWAHAADSVIISQHATLFILTTGIVFGRIAAKIILAYVTSMPYPQGTVALIPLIGGAILANSGYLFKIKIFDEKTEVTYLWLCFAFAVTNYAYWTTLTIEAICNKLGIRCLSITKPVSKKKDSVSNKKRTN